MPEGREPAIDVAQGSGPTQADRLGVGAHLGPYCLVSELGTGGMGMLYVGEHRKIGRRMAIKVLNKDLARRADIVRRFFDEARSVNTISHEHIVEIFDFIEEPNGYNYLVMELLDGGDLQQTRVRDGPYVLKRTLSIMAQVVSALGAVHKKEIVHRDIKPENVFLTHRAGQRDFVKLLDFGLAKLSESMKGKQDRTRAGTVLGTPEYMSPEQARGTTVDGRSDIYAVGLLMHWMLLDRLPWATRDLGELLTLREQIPLPLPHRTSGGEVLPRSVSEIVEKCLQPSPTKRFQLCDELEAALKAVDLGAGESPETFVELTTRVSRLAVVGDQPEDNRVSTLSGGSAAALTPPDVSDLPTETRKEVSSDANFLEVKPLEHRRQSRASQSFELDEEPRRLEIPWLALAVAASLLVLGYALYRTAPPDRQVLPEAPGSPYGASMLGPMPKAAPAAKVEAPKR